MRPSKLRVAIDGFRPYLDEWVEATTSDPDLDDSDNYLMNLAGRVVDCLWEEELH